MAHHRVSASALIPAPPAKVYALIADYRSGHPRILPKPYFVSLTVEQGGTGAGTVITFQMKLMGRLQTFHAVVAEPEPGRILTETDTDTGAVTTFTVEPNAGGQQTFVTITTDTQVPGGPAGLIQGWLTTWLLRPIYVKELAQLATVATSDRA
jgi:hypothetical protein